MENNTIDTTSNQVVEGTQTINSKQSLAGAVLGGFIGAAAGAAVWAIITAITEYEIGYTAIAVGFLTGFMVRKMGHGSQIQYGLIGAIWAFIGCFSGNILATLIMASNKVHLPFMTVLGSLNSDFISIFVKDTFSSMDLLFYGIAIYEGFRFSIISKNEDSEK